MAYILKPPLQQNSPFHTTVWIVTWLVALGTLGAYLFLWTHYAGHWLVHFWLLGMPLLWLFNAGMLAFWLWLRSARSWVPVLMLGAGVWLWPRTAAFPTKRGSLTGSASVQVLSYNISDLGEGRIFFSKSPEKKREAIQSSQHLMRWAVTHSANIKCFQEYHSSQRHADLLLTPRLRAAGYSHHRLLTLPEKYRLIGDAGLVTFSRYPIVNWGEHYFNETGNGLLWTDIVLPSRDTIRVLNVHLQSMGIRLWRLRQQRSVAGMLRELNNVLQQLQSGFQNRQRQTELLLKVVAQSPHPLIITGDFNDTPYSITYERLRRQLRNTFEDTGSGLGFTLSIAPYFVRIDNQFYDPKAFEPLDFRTYRDQKNSDHFPIAAWYVVK